MEGPQHILTGGNNRITTVNTVGTEDTAAILIERLTSIKEQAPDLQWIVVSAADAADWIGDVRSDPTKYRIRDGKVEARPEAWVVMSQPAAVVGDAVTFSVDFSSEDNAAAGIRIITYTGEGKVSEDHAAPLTIEFDVAGEYHFQPISAPHVGLITKVVIT